MDKVHRMLVTVQAAPDCIDVVGYAASLAEMLHAKGYRQPCCP
jgi:hypothetical protein